MTMGQRIKHLREAAGLSQTDLGKIVGATDKAVSTWEKDSKIPRMGKVQAMSEFFGVSKSFIIEGEEKPATEAGSRLEEAGYNSLTDDQKALVDALIRQLADGKK